MEDYFEQTRQYNNLYDIKEELMKDPEFLCGHSYCDYCGKECQNRDLHLEIEDETISSEQKSGMFGGIAIEKKWHYRVGKMCPKCRKVHKLVGRVHLINAIVLLLLLVFAALKNDKPFEFDELFKSFLILALIILVLSRIDWFFVKLILGVRRKPKVKQWNYLNNI